MSTAFQPGDHVCVRKAYPPGHLRTPFYIRGCEGVVESIAGDFANPEELAYGRDGLPPKRFIEFASCKETFGQTMPAQKPIAWLSTSMNIG